MRCRQSTWGVFHRNVPSCRPAADVAAHLLPPAHVQSATVAIRLFKQHFAEDASDVEGLEEVVR